MRAGSQGKAALPTPLQDYWAASELVAGSNRSQDVETATSRSRALRVYEAGDAAAPIFYPCLAARCKGGERFECMPGYTGTLCSECAQGQFYWRGRCDTSCADIEPQGVVTAFGIIAVVVVWIILNKSAGGTYAQPVKLSAAYAHMQLVAARLAPVEQVRVPRRGN